MTHSDSPAPIEMTMSDREAAGRLIIDLALGNVPKPENNEDALQLLAAHGIELENFTTSGKQIRFVSRDEALYIVLPPAELMRSRIEEYSESEGPYPLPDEYRSQIMGDEDALDALEMFYFRVGDYTFGQCR
ncbi:hypothetical protein [Oricola cellulosilytica]|uniref:Uncharacterized protein n=1 Tax=Oricola cellulosilytica TaxID=1429082 RepID=A0A4R0P9W9_9HYPH|nr:hypothetical protein [Oricola cellulosilytica]TCD14061.1 hypothetical protein E0D97_08170 [Oricola cellulosilytica]